MRNDAQFVGNTESCANIGNMGTTALVSIEEYLSTSYPDGDREYIDGLIVERNMGEHHHARLQALIAGYFLFHYKQFWCAVEARLKVSDTRYRIPDVCLITGKWPGPERGPLTEAPFLVVDVLSPDDRAGDMADKIADYLSYGVKYIWVINPETRRGFVHTIDGSREAKQGVLRTEDPVIELPLNELFQ
jgi:Uma2 family endonuclease